MDADLFLILPFVLVVVIVVTNGVTKIVNRALQHRERMAEREPQRGSSGFAEADYRRLEERVRVLERIATDESKDVARQIEALRVAPALENEQS